MTVSRLRERLGMDSDLVRRVLAGLSAEGVLSAADDDRFIVRGGQTEPGAPGDTENAIPSVDESAGPPCDPDGLGTLPTRR
jgi:hypothetical protein